MSSPMDVIFNEQHCIQTPSSMLKTYTSPGLIAKTWAQMSGFCSHEVTRCVFTPVKGGGMTSVSCGNRSLRCRFTPPPRKHEEMTPAGEMEAEIRMSGLYMKG